MFNVLSVSDYDRMQFAGIVIGSAVTLTSFLGGQLKKLLSVKEQTSNIKFHHRAHTSGRHVPRNTPILARVPHPNALDDQIFL